MHTQISHQVQVAQGLHIDLPIDVCQELGIKEGDLLQLVVINGEIHLQSRQQQIKQAQQLFKACLPAMKSSLADELIQERKVEANSE
ncbi:MAG: AbrB/MazE/SpoVT family DNA-binding domain-containing protein [Moraxellaceae bacterium]|nr:AbrB/MazE/SpoVT family DNA-binding domain-containing protein [Moraxellaceae bacterium]